MEYRCYIHIYIYIDGKSSMFLSLSHDYPIAICIKCIYNHIIKPLKSIYKSVIPHHAVICGGATLSEFLLSFGF